MPYRRIKYSYDDSVLLVVGCVTNDTSSKWQDVSLSPMRRVTCARARVHQQSSVNLAVDAWGHLGSWHYFVATNSEATQRLYLYTVCAAYIKATKNDWYTLYVVIYNVGVCGLVHFTAVIRPSLVIVMLISVVNFATLRGHFNLLRCPLLFVAAYWPSSFNARILTPWKFKSTARWAHRG